MTIHDDIATLRKEIDGKRGEADRLSRLAEAFPNLRKHVGRWNKIAYCSSDANPKVTRFDVRHNCGCCNDSPLEIWPYMETPHGNVYSDPPMFRVGEREPTYGGDIPYPNWDAEMRKAGIPEPLIGAVSMHFKQCAKEAREAAESLYGEDAVEGSDG